MCLLWPELSDIKKAQYKKALMKYLENYRGDLTYRGGWKIKGKNTNNIFHHENLQSANGV